MKFPKVNASSTRNIAAMCAAMALFVVNDTMVKLSTPYWPAHQIMLVRGIIAIAVMACVVIGSGHGKSLGLLFRPYVAFRCGIEGFIAYTFISALAYIPIADITAILLLSPLLMTVIAACFLGEAVHWRRWLAVIMGFIGMLLVIRPSGEGVGWPALFALASTVGVVLRDLMTRKLSADVPSSIVALGSTVATMLTGGMLALSQPLAALHIFPMMACLIAAVTVALGNLAIVLAFRNVEVSLVSPYRYTVILWAVLLGWVIFGDTPTLISGLGIALIVAGGLYTLRRERTV